LIEGSAMAMENDYLWRTLHQYVREMEAYGMAPEAEAIMGTSGFTSRRTSVSYVVAGSFSKWLIDTYGMAKYLKAFPWSDFEGAYGMSLHELSERYHAFIGTIPLPDENYRATMRYLFGGGSFFFQKCLRRMGTLNGEGYQALAEERYELALERFERSLDEGINYGARGGILRALAGMGRYRELLDSAAVYDRDTASYPLLPFLIERGDARWALGDVTGAGRLYDSMLALDISRQFSLRAAERRYFIDRSDSLAAIMRLYFTRPMRVTQRIAMLDEALTSSADHGERRVLTLMRASLIVDQLPRTAIETIRPLLASTRFDEVLADTTGEGRARLRLEAFIDGAIADQLEPALMMAPSGALPTGSLADLMPGAAIGMPGRYHIDDASPRGSGMYMNERRTERDRFISYLSTHPVLQK
jgi:tetratricopeptide (TPR) repeat protein